MSYSHRICFRLLLVCAVLLWLIACGDDDDGVTTDAGDLGGSDGSVEETGTDVADTGATDIGDDVEFAFEIGSSGESESVEVDGSDEQATVVSNVGGALGVVLSVDDAVTLLGGQAEKDGLTCASTTQQPDDELLITFTDCDHLSGSVTMVRDTDADPTITYVTFENDFAIGDSDIDGVIHITAVDGEILTYAVEAGDGVGEPNSDDDIVVTDQDDVVTGIFFSGYFKLNVIGTTWSLWGTGTSRKGAAIRTLVLGGVSVGEVSQTAPPSSALIWDLPRRNCDCPVAGTLMYETLLPITTATIDFDRFKDPNDGGNDFRSFSVGGLTAEFSGKAVVVFTECGELTATFEAGLDVSVNVGREKIVTRLAELCADGSDSGFTDAQCRVLNWAAGKIDSTRGLDVEIPDLQLNGALLDAIDQRFDRGICE